MTNEERIEEIVFEAHKLNSKDELFELIKVLSKDKTIKDRIDLYEMAIKIIRNNGNNTQ
jgi:hypothetical protein